MANNDDQLTLGLNVPKSVAQINADIKKLENQLKTVKATGALDSAPTVKKINLQISALQSQLKTIKIDADFDMSELQRTGQTAGQTISDSIGNAIGDISVFDNLNNEIKDLEINLNDLNSQIGKMQLSEVSEGVEKTESSVSGLGKVGAFFSEQMSQVAKSFSQWLFVGNTVEFLISKVKDGKSKLRFCPSWM